MNAEPNNVPETDHRRVRERLGQEKSTQSELANLAWRVYFRRFRRLSRSPSLTQFDAAPLPGGVMVARVTLDHLVKVRILSGQ